MGKQVKGSLFTQILHAYSTSTRAPLPSASGCKNSVARRHPRHARRHPRHGCRVEGPAGSRAWTKGPATIEAMIEAMIKGPHGFAAKATTDHYVLQRNQEFLVSGVSRIRDKKEIPGFRNFSHQRSNLAYNALLTSVQQVTLSWEVQRLSVTRAGAGEPVPNEMAQRPPGRRCSSVA